MSKLKTCKDCGAEISKKANDCPKCGAPNKSKGVGCWAATVLLFVILFAITTFADSIGVTNPKQTKSQSIPVPQSVQNPKPTNPTPVPQFAQKKAVSVPASAWQYTESTDKMSGEVSSAIYSESENILKGWLKNGKVLFVYTCQSGFYARAKDIGFHIDTVNYRGIFIKRLHYARVKFDDGPAQRVIFNVRDDNNDVMLLIDENDMGNKGEAYFINGMKTGSRMFLEVTLFNTKGSGQIAEFDLTGFTKAFNQCQ
jgi:RNA polymerase subunit RPABC4/transcription elongation factor Spt4